jgi:stage II sporulation protein D
LRRIQEEIAKEEKIPIALQKYSAKHISTLNFSMQIKFLLPLVFAVFACAPLRPLAPETLPETPTPGTIPEKPKEEPPVTPPEEPAEQDTVKRQIIDVGVGFEKKSAVIECPEKKWEFKAKDAGKTEIETAGTCKYAGKTYRGNWAVLATDSGIAVINRLSVEDYLKGVVPHEIGKLQADGFEALKAQAVAARTYAYKHLNSRKSQGFDVYADTRDQVYSGSDGEDSLVNAAILATRDLVIKHNGNLIEAYYHSTCGGKTESPEVWEQESRPYLLSVSDSANGRVFCELSRYMKWEEKFTAAELVNLFRKNAASAKADRIFPFGKVELILITEKFPSGRVKRLVIFTDKGSFEVFGDRTRWLFARDGKILPGSSFTISQNKNQFTLSGSGFGHGIGMCQMGTIARAKEGQTYEEILKAYYTGVSIEAY